MSIKILPKDDIQKSAKNTFNPPLLFAVPKILYKKRAERLQKLAQNNPMADYLLFVAKICQVQDKLLTDFELQQEIELSRERLADKPLNYKHWQRDPVWIKILFALLQHLKKDANEMVLASIDNLEKTSDSELENLADQLLNQEFHNVGSDKAVFLWAALSFYWTQLTQNIPHNAVMESGQALHTCPVCDSAPVSSVIHLGSTQGLRYLHCSLCESEWNMVRAKCSTCDQMDKLDYWAIDDEFASVRTESCSDCHTYLKVLYQEKDPHIDAIADDLASIYLDIEMGEKEFLRSGLNPFLFSSEG
ncbi:formate dehydrogenase accessory protein FdhE [Pasteurella atlantica]|uniref:Formate dehydrogenase accessory protein FdhE n=2 Tax=Pasteurellaceae TaxID=712 RepID=A0ACC6HME1_9PAST|nr:formate dehydrogenase accessory protein FdhE [Pasteurella atlantica]MDP8051999.1 formate dehydrogenase accessory protein FdhE [Pasteurella atlantica]MDP8105482.1 formate dehydrogenase accessory protein FdhE [Pasteurella atlantica]MDP8148815.1 formate dehydrogenase accessory protein FdhE [Pasteurella atlantica]